MLDPMTTAQRREPAPVETRGYAGYTPLLLGIYDLWVHRINNRFFWKCPTRCLIARYTAYITANHLEIGPGTGYLLDKCAIPGMNPRLVLCDMNLHCLEHARHRLRRYNPIVVRRNILEPLEGLGERFQSVGINYVLHCLPGDLKSKRKVFHHLAAWLEPGGVVFGSTLLGREVPLSPAARLQVRLLRRGGYFSNQNDSLSDLRSGLAETFAEHHVEVHGCAALFWARVGT
jgi:hypothetical protein